MEAAGTGFDKIMEEYASADEAHKPYIYSTSDHFTLVLPDLTYEEGVLDATITILTFIPAPNGTEHDEKVLSFCYKKARKVSEIAEHLGLSDSTYFRKKVLENLEKNGYLIKSKVSRATCYITNPEVVEEG
jgi:predicted HTH transcriptional regulator